MDRFYITCPWCTETSEHEADLSQVTVSSVARMEETLEHKDRSHGLFRCKTRDCVAPVEMVVIANPNLADEVQSHVLESWTVPKLARLRTSLDGALHPYLYSLLFNVSPVEQKRIHELSALMDLDLLSKAMLGFAVSKQIPVALFEGHVCRDRIEWLRVQAASTPNKEHPFQYNAFCMKCREIFDERVRRELPEHETGTNCAHRNVCPSHSCDESGGRDHIDLNRCLTALTIKKNMSLCHNSDLAMIPKVVAEFVKPREQQAWPVRRTCWLGLTELGFPVAVHNHLAGVIMTGQFLATDDIPKDAAEAVAKWAQRYAGVAEKSVLEAEQRSLSEILAKATVVPFAERAAYRGEGPVFIKATDEDIRRIGRMLKADVDRISSTSNHRYLQMKERTEGAFRAEMSGTLLRNLLAAKEFPGFLVHMLSRMKRFWAFEKVCLLMGSDTEETLEVYATDSEYLAREDSPLLAPYSFDKYEGARSTVVPPGGAQNNPADGADAGVDKSILSRLKDHVQFDLAKQAFVVRVQRASRAYVFCFSGRDEALLSMLPRRRQEDTLVLSPQARLQIETTCQRIAEELYHFWFKYDQEQTYRALSHSLKSPVSIMFSPRGRFLHFLHRDSEMIQQMYPDLFKMGTRFAEAVKIGASIVNDELRKFPMAASLDEKLAKAKEGTTDLIPLLRDLRRKYEFVGIPNEKEWEGNETSFRNAFVVGLEEMVALAVQNVIDNAYKYSLNRKPISITLAEDSSGWVLKVRDFGTAIAPDELERIGQKGFRGIHARRKKAAAAQGTGLGMYLVTRILPAIGGECHVTCTPPKTGEANSELGEVEVELRFPAAAKGESDAQGEAQ